MPLFQESLTIYSDTGYLEMLRAWIQDIARKLGDEKFPQNAILGITTSLIEAVNNAIFHAHKGKVASPVIIHLKVEEDYILLDVVDQGAGFALEERSLPQDEQSSGRGVFLIQHFMHEIESITEDHQHTLRMKYHL